MARFRSTPGLVRKKRAGSCDDAFKPSQRLVGVPVDPPCRRDIVRCDRIAGEKRGNSIAFVASPNSASSVEVASADGTGMHRVSPRAWTSYSPTWTPGGKIVFLRQIGSPTQGTVAQTSAYIVNPDGSGLRLLYSNLDASQIAWGPATLPSGTCDS